MKKRVLALIFAMCLSVTATACGKEQLHNIIESESFHDDIQVEEKVDDTQNVIDEEKEVESNQEVDGNKEEILPEEETTGFTFKDLSTRQFYFESGAGAWREWFTIEKDGYLTGHFSDSNMGENGEGYPDGTFYCCSYSGHFTDLIKVGEYIYEMKLTDISYKEEPGTEEIIDGVKNVYTDAYFMGANDTFRIYLPGMPINEISEELYWWVRDCNRSESELTMIVLVDEKNELAAYSVDRFTPAEDAEMTYNSYKQSFDYWADKLANEAQTTAEMVEYSGRMYEVSDDCLNELWKLIRYNLPEDRYAELLKEQRAWIKEKEEKAKEAADAYEGGSFAGVSANDMLAQLTIERCAKLVEYLQ